MTPSSPRLCVRCGEPVGETSYYLGPDGPFCKPCSDSVSPRDKSRQTWVGWLMSLWSR